MSEVEVLVQSSSDHRYIQATRFAKQIRSNPRYVVKRSYRDFEEAVFIKEVQKISWWEIYQTENPDVAAQLFSDKICKVLDKFAPIKKIQIRTKFAAWLSEDLKLSMAERDVLQEKAVASQLEKDWINYRKIRNKVNRSVKMEKAQWQRRKLESCDGDPSQTWGNILGWLGWSSSSSPSKLYSGNQIDTSPKKNAEIMNRYYVEKVKTIKAELPPPSVDPLSTLQEMMNGCPTTFEFSAVSSDKVNMIISKLKNSKSSGLDDIDSYIMKLIRKEIVTPLTHIVNLSLTHAIYPASYKVGKVVPLYKGKGSLLEPSSYRPVCLLPVASKVLERAAYVQVMEYMESNGYFHPNHHGFRGGRSTTTALLQLYDTWVEEVDKQQIAGACLIDLSAAFDVVDAKLLLAKLRLYGWSRHAQQWVWSYMTLRSQKVYLEGSLSEEQKLQYGVPQGSILGPLLYVIFTNEFPEVIHQEECPEKIQLRNVGENPSEPWRINLHTSCKACGSTVIYADDSTYSTSKSEPQPLATELSEKYSVMSKYLSSSGLKVNDDKTHTMILSTSQMRRCRDLTILVRTGEELAAPSEVERLLGVNVHQDMKWNENIMNNNKSLMKQLQTRTNALAMVGKVANFKTRKMIADGIWNSKLCYCISLFGGTEGYLLKALQKMQNRAAKLACKRGRRYSPSKALLELGWLPVTSMVKYNSLLLTKKTLETKKPEYLYEKLVGGRNRLDYATRLCVGGNLQRGPGLHANLTLTKNSWRWRVRKIWSEVPAEIRTIENNFNAFKKELKKWMWSRL